MLHLSPAKQKALTGLLFLAILLLGFFTAADYGRPWDESDEISILRMNLWEYARAFGLDETVFQQWADRNDDVLIARLTPISESAEQDHGVAAFYPVAGVALNLSLTGHSRMVLWHLWCWALFTLGLYALYACCRALDLPRWAGVTAALFLLLSPRFFAEGHYNNKDVALLALVLCALWQGLRLMKKPTFPRALLFSLAGAFAANTKIVGFALWGLIGLFVIARQLMRRAWNRRTLAVGLTALFAFFAFYALLTPALWRDPWAFARYMWENTLFFSRWDGYVRFRGVTYGAAGNPLPRYYLPYMMVVTTPGFIVLLAAGGQVGIAASIGKRRRELAQRDDLLGLLLCSLMWLLPLVFAVAVRAKVYNGWRHFYFLYGPLLIIAAWGTAALAERVKGKRLLRRSLGVLLALCLLCAAGGVVRWHPFQYAYYQPLERAFAQADDQELDYWNVSVNNALALLAKEREGVLTVSYADYWTEMGLRRSLPGLEPLLRERFVLTDSVRQADYVFSNPTYALFSHFAPIKSWTEAVSITAYGRTIMTVYATRPERQATP